MNFKYIKTSCQVELIFANRTRNIVFNFAAMELRNTLFVVTVARHWNKLPFKTMEIPE